MVRISLSYIAFAVFVWVVGTFLGATMEEQYLATQEISVGSNVMTVQSALDVLLSFQIVKWQDIAWMSLPVPNIEYFQVMLNTITWDFAFMTGGWEYVRWFVFLPISAAIGFGMMILFINAVMGFLRR